MLGSSLHPSRPLTFEELAIAAHDMKLSIASHNGKSLPADDQHKDKRKVKKTTKRKSSVKEAMGIVATLVKLTGKDRKKEPVNPINKKKKVAIIKRIGEKEYTFSDSDISRMLDNLLDKRLIQLT